MLFLCFIYRSYGAKVLYIIFSSSIRLSPLDFMNKVKGFAYQRDKFIPTKLLRNCINDFAVMSAVCHEHRSNKRGFKAASKASH